MRNLPQWRTLATFLVVCQVLPGLWMQYLFANRNPVLIVPGTCTFLL